MPRSLQVRGMCGEPSGHIEWTGTRRVAEVLEATRQAVSPWSVPGEVGRAESSRPCSYRAAWLPGAP